MLLRTSGGWMSHFSGAPDRALSGLLVLPGPAPMNRIKLRPEQVQAGLEILRSYFDQVILDLPHDMDAATASALEASDTIFFLVSQNVPPSV